MEFPFEANSWVQRDDCDHYAREEGMQAMQQNSMAQSIIGRIVDCKESNLLPSLIIS